MDVTLVSLILVIFVFFLVTERVGMDLLALGIITALMVSGLLTPNEAVAGFANPAVLTVGAMFLISRALVRTGAVGFIGQRVLRLSRGNPGLALAVTLVIVAVASAFINNTPVVVLFIPVVMGMCCKFNLSPSRFLIPVSYASILAGTCTLIGTSTNIIASDLSQMYGHGELGMFELAVVGLPIAVVGIIFLIIAAPRLMPNLLSPTCELASGEHRRYLAELVIPPKSRFRDHSPDQALQSKYHEVETLELIRDHHIYHPERDSVAIAPGDRILVRGSATDLIEMLHDGHVELPSAEKGLSFGSGDKATLVAELIIPPQSELVGKRLQEIDLLADEAINLVAVKRRELHFTEKSLPDMRLRMGDILLIWGPAAKLEQLRGQPDFIIVEDVHHEIVQKSKARKAFVIFMGLVVAAGFGIADMMVCALAAAFLMIALGCLPMRDAYRSLQGPVLLLIAGSIALGAAMEKTGASQVYAELFLSLFDSRNPTWILGGFILLTSISTQILSNNATAVLLIPVAISTAQSLGVDPKPLIIGVCIGASACFATPIGYQTNLLVYGPGGYRFSDYLKLGIPLNILVLGMGTALIPVFWPF